MAKDTSRKATPRAKTPLKRDATMGASRGTKAVSMPSGRKAKVSLPKTKAAPKVAGPSKRERPAKPSKLRAPKSSPRAKAAAGTNPSSGARRPTGAEAREERLRHNSAPVGKIVARVLTIVAALAIVALIAYVVLRNSPSFAITSIEAEPTTHVSVDDIQNLVNVEDGTTLLNVNTDAITASLEKNPWIASVSYDREFPGTLKITITERKVYALVTMSSGSVGWYLGEGNVWMEPTKITTTTNQSVEDAALTKASSEGELLITGLPATVQPVAGSLANDAVLDAVATCLNWCSSDFSSQIVSFSASSVDSISCDLSSGVEVSLGAATNVSSKESVVLGLLDKYPGELTYINVRVPSNPSYRRIDSDTVQACTGATGKATDSSTTTTTGTTTTSADTESTSIETNATTNTDASTTE